MTCTSYLFLHSVGISNIVNDRNNAINTLAVVKNLKLVDTLLLFQYCISNIDIKATIMPMTDGELNEAAPGI